MQEYQAIKKAIGEQEWNLIERFLECHKHYLLGDVLYNIGVQLIYEKWKINNP